MLVSSSTEFNFSIGFPCVFFPYSPRPMLSLQRRLGFKSGCLSMAKSVVKRPHVATSSTLSEASEASVKRVRLGDLMVSSLLLSAQKN